MTVSTLGRWFDRSLRFNADRVAIQFADDEISYQVLDEWSSAIAAALAAKGVDAGDVVALLIGNHPAFIACDIAIARLGGVKLPVNPLLPPATVNHILTDSGAQVLVVGPEQVRLARNALARGQDSHGNLPVLQVCEPDSDAIEGASSLPDVSETSTRRESHVEEVSGHAPGALYYTGGTTGVPKGVVHSQRSLVAFHAAQLLEAEIRQHERLLLHTPLAHAAGLFAQSAILRGATIVLRTGFDASKTLIDLRDHAITWTFLVPTMIYRLLDIINEEDDEASRAFPSLDTVVYGAAPIAPSRLAEALDIFGPVFVQLYGQTECPNWGTRLSKSDHLSGDANRLASCGQASLFVDVKVVGEDGEDLPVGETGEICLRSPYTLTRYHRNEEATQEKFLGDWIRTGDIGLLDDKGYLYLKDRRADMIISGGMNVYCREVEDVLNAHPQVRAAAVIGIPHEDWGEAVHAVVVAEGLSKGDLLAWVRDRVAAYARPKSVEFAETLPETPFGKIDKKKLRESYWTGADRFIN